MIVDFVISGRFIRILILWKLWNLPANKVKRGDFDCNSSLSLFHNEGPKSNAKAQNVLKQIKMGLNFPHALVSSFMPLIYSCKRNYV